MKFCSLTKMYEAIKELVMNKYFIALALLLTIGVFGQRPLTEDDPTLVQFSLEVSGMPGFLKLGIHARQLRFACDCSFWERCKMDLSGKLSP